MQGYEDYIAENAIPETEVKTGFNFDNNYLQTKIKKSKEKFSQCNVCSKNNICEGPWKEYPEIYGNEEFKPIK